MIGERYEEEHILYNRTSSIPMIFRLKPFITVVLMKGGGGNCMGIQCNRSDPAHGTAI